MEFKGTRGEWAIIPNKESNGLVSKNMAYAIDDISEEWAVCAVWKDCGINDKTAKANAQLIAAAPDLLEALKEMLYMTGGSARFSSGMSKTIEEAEQLAIKAIKKALG